MVGSIVVVGAHICCALLHSVCDLKAAQMNEQRALIREFIFNKFELDHNTAEAIKSICCAKIKGAIDQRTVTR